MFNSQNLPVDVTYTIKQASKATKQLRDLLDYSELQTLNLKLAEREYKQAIRDMRKASLLEIDSRWVELLA